MRLGATLFLFALVGCASPEYRQYQSELDAIRAEREALTDPQEKSDYRSAEARFMIEDGARPFSDVLAEVKRVRRENEERIRASVERQLQQEQQLQDAIIDAELLMRDIQKRQDERRWAEEVALRDLAVGDHWPRHLISDRQIENDDGSTVYIFQRKDTVGVNTTVTVDASGIITDIQRYPD